MMTSARPRPGTQAILLCLIATAALTVADLWSKDWAQTALSRERSTPAHDVCEPNSEGRYAMQRVRTDTVVLIDDYLEFRYAENCGAAFGMLNQSPKWLRATVFFGAGAFWTVALMYMFVTGVGGRLFAWSVPLILSGAIGNLVDRARLGYVVDFIRFHIQEGWEWPTFNVADITIAVGLGLMLLDGLFHREGSRKDGSVPAPADASAR